MNTNITSFGLSIDGGYYCKISDELFRVNNQFNNIDLMCRRKK